MEEYLKVRWSDHKPSLGPLPTGEDAIAKMRLLCMAQTNANQLLKEVYLLSEEDQDILSLEMGRTGCHGQRYSAGLAPEDAHLKGPAFLVYYGPAFLQCLGNDSPMGRLKILAEVYFCAREIWPATDQKAGSTVTIRIDTIKALSIAQIWEVLSAGEMWLLVKHNDSEAFIETSSKRKLNRFVASGTSVQILFSDNDKFSAKFGSKS